MKTQKVFSLTLLTLALAACGSGGGSGGGDNHPTQLVQQPATQTTQPTTPATQTTQPTTPATQTTQPTTPETKPAQPTEEKPKNTITGHYYNGFFGFASNISSNDINAIRVWGTDIQLIDPAMKSANGWLSDSVDNLSNRIVSDFLNHARVGLAIRQSDVVAFAQGKETIAENVPTVGKAHYKGQHILTIEHSKEVQQETKAKYGSFRGEALFDIDFANKKIAGSLELPTLEGQTETAYLPVSATINGNTFENKAFIDDVSVKGKFYGENASEMAGVYQKMDKFTGAFGAKKQ
ncbi:transferrin-binding protein-like solute binding protein [Aggregatibacter sp.]